MAARVSSSADPRMAVLRDPATLQQLWKGSQRNYRWGGRQPLRRRRGDVHGDLSAVVIRLDWAGGPALPPTPPVCPMVLCNSSRKETTSCYLSQGHCNMVHNVQSLNIFLTCDFSSCRH